MVVIAPFAVIFRIGIEAFLALFFLFNTILIVIQMIYISQKITNSDKAGTWLDWLYNRTNPSCQYFTYKYGTMTPIGTTGGTWLKPADSKDTPASVPCDTKQATCPHPKMCCENEPCKAPCPSGSPAQYPIYKCWDRYIVPKCKTNTSGQKVRVDNTGKILDN